MNDGTSDAHNFSIRLLWTPTAVDWVDFKNIEVVSATLPPVCKAKSAECEFDIIPMREPIRLDFDVDFKQNIEEISRTETAVLLFEYSYDGLPSPKQVVLAVEIPK